MRSTFVLLKYIYCTLIHVLYNVLEYAQGIEYVSVLKYKAVHILNTKNT